MKKLISFIVVLAMLMSVMVINSSAAVSEQTFKLFDESAGVAKGHIDSDGYIVMTWANNCGMRFDVHEDELLTGVTFRTIIKDIKIKACLYKWNTSLNDKELLEEKELLSVDWLQVVFDFDKVYGAGTYYAEVVTYGKDQNDAGANAPYLYAQKKVAEGRNIAAFQYDRTWEELNNAESSITNGYNFGEGFDMSIKVLKGVTEKAQLFMDKYEEAKAEGVIVFDQAKYDSVMNTVGSDLKAFMTNASDDTLNGLINDLTVALSEPESEPNPGTGDNSLTPYFVMVTFATAAFAIFVILKRSKVNV